MNASSILPTMLLGFGTGLALICAIGAQNAYLLRLGIEGRTRTVLVVVLICAVSDAALIIGGVAGIGAIIDAAPLAVDIMRIFGVTFLLAYGLFAARRAFRPGVMPDSDEPAGLSLKAAVLTTLALTWLNPHVYLDTVIFLGSVANHQGADGRWWWAAGAVIASFTWFFAIGFGSRLLRPLFAKPGSWRVLDGAIAFIMIALGLGMAFGS
ncbi:MAG: LysE/ArgO family amino acid transporter [Solirubrobacterales bacterium]